MRAVLPPFSMSMITIPEMLRYFDQLGILPGTVVQVVAKEPFNGPLRLKIDQTEHFVGREVAGNVFVSPQTI